MKSGLVTLALVLTFIGTVAAPAITLDEAVTLGRQRSLRMQEPVIEQQRDGGRIMEAWSNALPQVEGQIAYQRSWKSPVIFFPDFITGSGQIMQIKTQQDNSALAEATLSQPLLTFGRVSAGIRAAYAARRANEHVLRGTDQAVQLEVMKRFWTVLLMRDVVAARRSSLAISDSSLAKVQRMRDVGLMSDYDVLRVRVQAANQVPQLRQAENALRLSELSLRELLGVPIDTALTAEGSLSEHVVPLDTAGAGIHTRHDLQALRELADVNKNQYTIYRNAYWPLLAGQVKYSWQWSNNEWAMNKQNNASSVYGGLALSIPIWTSGAQGGRARQFKADWQKSVLDLRQAERGAELQYEAALRSYRAACESEEAAGLALEQAEQARRIAETKLAQGQITPLEMDAAQLDELVARVALAQSKYDRLVAAAETRLSIGLAPYASLENLK